MSHPSLEQQLTLLQKKLGREQAARHQAEQLLEDKSRELFEANEAIKRNQAYLVQSEKMTSLGQLAAGVAHEINNPIGFVTSNLATLDDYVEGILQLLTAHQELQLVVTTAQIAGQLPGSVMAEVQPRLATVEKLTDEIDLEFILGDLDDLVTESKDGLVRVADIVQNLKSFARLDEATESEFNCNDCIESALKVVWNELKYKSEVVKHLTPDLPNVWGNAGQINQVLVNLLMNAAQAMPDDANGEITLATLVDDGYVQLTVSDNGSGIPEDVRTQIFNPFFTTKPVGTGTGLGLSIVYGIIEQHKGTIALDSTMGEGTTFTIRLPIKA